MDDRGATALAHSLKHCTTLRKLDIGGRFLSCCVQQRLAITQSCFTGNKVGSIGVTALAASASSWSSLECLHLAGACIRDSAVSAFVLIVCMAWLTGDVLVSARGISTLMDGLRHCTQLKELVLGLGKFGSSCSHKSWVADQL